MFFEAIDAIFETTSGKKQQPFYNKKFQYCDTVQWDTAFAFYIQFIEFLTCWFSIFELLLLLKNILKTGGLKTFQNEKNRMHRGI
jgi:hypothetical protein